MTFISYTPLDAVGIGAGLSLLEKVTHSFWEGSFLGEGLLAIFVFLSLAKIAMDSIIEHRYDRAIIDFTKIAIIILLFNVTTTATIFDMDIINFGYARQAAMNGGITSNPTPTSTQIQIPNVPLMADIYAIPDNLAYQLANLMLNPRKTMTIDLANVVLNPLSIIDYSFDNMVYSSHDPIKMYEEFAYCYDRDAYKALRTEGKPNMSCSEFNNLWASTAKQMESQIQQQGNVNPTVLGDMNYAIDLIQSGYFQNNKAYKDAYLKHEMEALQQIAPDIEKINNSYIQTSKGNPSNNALINGIEGSINTGLNMAAFDMYHLYLPRQFMESLMMHMQEYAIAIMFLLLPFVVILGLLPIFGSNYKLIIKYAVSFFLIKLWVPILWLIYISMVNVSAILMGSAVNIEHEMRNGIQYAITTFTGNTAFAQTQQQTGNGQPPAPQPANSPPPPTPASPPPPGSGSPYNLPQNPSSDYQRISHEAILVKIAEEHSRLNDLILTSMYGIIPTVLGSSATYLVGKGMVDAGVAAYAEGAMLAKQFLTWGVKNAPKIVENAIKFVRGVPGAISAIPGIGSSFDFAKSWAGMKWNNLKSRFGFGSNDENTNDPTGNGGNPTGDGNNNEGGGGGGGNNNNDGGTGGGTNNSGGGGNNDGGGNNNSGDGNNGGGSGGTNNSGGGGGGSNTNINTNSNSNTGDINDSTGNSEGSNNNNGSGDKNGSGNKNSSNNSEGDNINKSESTETPKTGEKPSVPEGSNSGEPLMQKVENVTENLAKDAEKATPKLFDDIVADTATTVGTILLTPDTTAPANLDQLRPSSQ